MVLKEAMPRRRRGCENQIGKLFDAAFGREGASAICFLLLLPVSKPGDRADAIQHRSRFYLIHLETIVSVDIYLPKQESQFD